jgi:hypothetical protein
MAMDQKGEHDHQDSDDDQYTFQTHVGLNFSVLLSFLHYLRILAYFEKHSLLLDADVRTAYSSRTARQSL